jgi:hypothetical protein
MIKTMMTGSIVLPVPFSASALSEDLMVVEDLAGRVCQTVTQLVVCSVQLSPARSSVESCEVR